MGFFFISRTRTILSDFRHLLVCWDGAALLAPLEVAERDFGEEAMKLFNPIKASATGRITFLVEHGKPVTKGQAIASIA